MKQVETRQKSLFSTTKTNILHHKTTLKRRDEITFWFDAEGKIEQCDLGFNIDNLEVK